MAEVDRNAALMSRDRYLLTANRELRTDYWGILAKPTGEPEYREYTGERTFKRQARPKSVELSSKTKYALLALLELARHYQQQDPLQIRQIAARQNIPDRYLEQLLAVLRRGKLVRSQRGAKGGYLLALEPWRITLREAIDCLEGPDATTAKDDTIAQTVEQAVVGDVWQEAYRKAEAVLQQYTLQDLCDKCDARQQLDLMYYI